jgi:hypothetical protein
MIKCNQPYSEIRKMPYSLIMELMVLEKEEQRQQKQQRKLTDNEIAYMKDPRSLWQ